MTSASSSRSLPDTERYQHQDTLITAEAKAWLSEFHTEARLSAQGPDKTVHPPEPERAQRRLAPWEVLTAPVAPRRNTVENSSEETATEQIREVLEANRTEFYLQPVASLEDRKVKFYEGLTRLRDARGQIIMPAVYLPLATKAGLASEIDNLLAMRCIKVLESLRARHYDLGVFCNFSQHALGNMAFFTPFRTLMEKRRDLAPSLIFEFSQETLNALGTGELKNLISLADLGFRFSLDNIHDLNIDFIRLHKLGFRYLKVDGDILLKGQDREGMNFVTVLLAQQIRESGLKLIAHRLEIQEMADTLHTYGLRLGQGYLYGKPRLIRPAATAKARGSRLSFSSPGLKDRVDERCNG